MNEINNGGPAFPHSETKILRGGASYQKVVEGMSLRDWFAGLAMQSAWAAYNEGRYVADENDMAKCAYQFADAMLKAREAGNE